MTHEDSTADLAIAQNYDHNDDLRRFRERFHIPRDKNGNEAIYFTGNSLGLQPKTARSYVVQELDDWATFAVEGHIHAKNPWLPYHEFLTDKMAAIVGAKPIETVVMNSLTVNLHLLLVSFYRPTTDRHKIIIEKGAFPSDRYAIASQIRFHGFDPATSLIEIEPRPGENVLRTEDFVEAIQREGPSLATILLGGVNYYTGQAFQMREITAAGHAVGAVVGFDLAHAAGNLDLHLHDWGVDFAAWCSYKYLNAGPGGVAGAFVHERHADCPELPRFAGWWGHDKSTRFQMGPEFHVLRGAEVWQISNPPIFQMAALRASLESFDEAGMSALRAKSVKLTGYLESLIANIGNDRISVITPSDPEQRGCQLSIRVKGGERSLFEKLTDRGVVADWREPDVIRVAPAPLYNSFEDAFRFAEMLRSVLE